MRILGIGAATAFATVLVASLAMPATGLAGDETDFQTQMQAMEWRNVGPFNGGRGTSVVGHPTDPWVFYFGHSSGGLWKTADAGAYWTPVGEGQFRYASVGAIALHEKNPDIMYVGLGEPQLRQSVSWGDGMYKTVDGGETWQRLNLNMPPLPVFDLEVKNADLIAATHGAGFWILDDISPLRQYSAELAAKKAHLFEPEDHTRFGYNWWLDYGGGPPSDEKYFFVRNAEPGYTFYERGIVNGERKREYIDAGDARPRGVILYYLLSDQAQDVSLSILDEQGNEIRTFGTDEIPMRQFSATDGREYAGGGAGEQPRASVGKGLNRFMWDMRYPMVSAIPGLPPVNIKPIAKPGTYQVRLTVDGEPQTQSFELKAHPDESYSRAETDAKAAAWMALYDKAEEGVQAVLRAQAAREEVADALEAGSGHLASQARKVTELCNTSRRAWWRRARPSSRSSASLRGPCPS